MTNMKPLMSAAYLAEAVYRGQVPAGLGVLHTAPIFDPATQTEGMVYITGNCAWVVFAGTHKKRHWLSNFKISRKNCFGWFKAHKGFSECAEAVIGQCMDALNKYSAGTPIVVTGHSLGGAIALLVAIGIRSRAVDLEGKRREVSCITFGQPRVSTRAAIESVFRSPYIRVQNGSDTIPRVPRFGYSHAGTCLYLRNGEGYCVDPSLIERFLNRLPTIFQRASDHSMADYIRELEGLKLCE